MGSVLDDHLDGGLFDGSLDDVDVNDHDNDVLDDEPETLVGNLEALWIEIGRLIDEVSFVPNVSNPFSSWSAGLSIVSCREPQQMDS